MTVYSSFFFILLVLVTFFEDDHQIPRFVGIVVTINLDWNFLCVKNEEEKMLRIAMEETAKC